MTSRYTCQIPTSPVECNTAPLYWDQACSEQFHNDCGPVLAYVHDDSSLQTSSSQNILPLCVTKRTEPVTRSEFTEHNAMMIETGRRQDLWAVDTKRVYQGYTLYCYLKPFIEVALAASTGSRPTENDSQNCRAFLDNYCQTYVHDYIPLDATTPKKCKNSVDVVNGTAQCSLDKDGSSIASDEEETDMHVDDYLFAKRLAIYRTETERRWDEEASTKRSVAAEMRKLHHNLILTKRQRLTQQHIETKQPYNTIFHHLSIFRLPKDVIEAAKDAAAIGSVADDPYVQVANENDMIKLEPYLSDIRNAIEQYKLSDEEFDRNLRSITRAQFSLHNQSLLQFGNRENPKLWTVDVRRVYNRRNLQTRCVQLITQYDRSALNRLHSYKYTMVNRHGACGITFQFRSKFHLRENDIDRLKRQVAIGRLTEDPDIDVINQQHIQLLLDELTTTQHDSEILSDFINCALRYAASAEQGKTHSSWSGDINQLVFPFPNDVELDSLRHWPDYIWHDRDKSRQWVDDWTLSCDDQPYDGKNDSIFTSTEETFSDILPWRNTCEPFDTDIDGEVAWDMLPEDVIRNDDATETQIVTMQRRATKSWHKSAEWMAMRRAELTRYFVSNFRNREEDLVPYIDWTDRMQVGWNVFEELCTTWHCGYIQPRPMHQQLPLPTPWQSFMSPMQCQIHQQAMLLYFKNHKHVNNCDVERYRTWHERMNDGWKHFLLVCDTWTSDDIPDKYNQHK